MTEETPDRSDALDVLDYVRNYCLGYGSPYMPSDDDFDVLRAAISQPVPKDADIASQVYQAVGVLLSDAGRFADDDGQDLLTACSYLAGQRDVPPKDLLPFDSQPDPHHRRTHE